MFADNEVLDIDDDFGNFDDEDFEGLSSDVDRWEEDSFDADRNYIVGLLR